MGKDSPSPAPAPDPYATARAQTSSNVSTAVANTVLGNANETGPLGSVRYNQNGSYKLSEPVLDKDGNQSNTRRWVADGTGQPNDPQFKQQVGGGGGSGEGGGNDPISYIDSRTGQAWSDGTSGGHWVDEPSVTTREIPQWERITTLSPQEQAKYDKTNSVEQKFLDIANSQAGRLESSLGTPLDFGSVPDYTKDVLAKLLSDDGSASRGRVEDALLQRLNPQLQQDRSALETQLSNQGFGRGSEAYNRELDSANRQSTDARLAVTAAGGQEQALQQQLLLQQLGAAGTSRDRSIQELMTQRNAPINEISALLGQSQVNMPQFSPYQAGTIAGTPVGDYVYKSADINQKNYQAEVQANASTNGGLFGLGGSALSGLFNGGTKGFAGSAIGGLFGLGGSDRRIKKNIRPAGSLRNGLPLYIFEYIAEDSGEYLGVMAQDVELVNPAAVTERGGIKFVDYVLASQPLPLAA